MTRLQLLVLVALLSLFPVISKANKPPTCFPYGSAKLPKDFSKPDIPLKDWWCPQSMAYGFQGFSYPLEVDNCSDPSNSFESMNKDFARMKADFGASIVRMYYATCLNASVFENALKAGVANNMAVIFQVWTNFGVGDVWKQSQQAIYDVMDSAKYSHIAPYVVHSADFGSEPIGDGMDGGGDQFIIDLGLFRAKMNSYGVPAGISEDWDRPDWISGPNGVGLTDLGEEVKANSDYCHAHVMPFYQGDLLVNQTWNYIQEQIVWLNGTVSLPTMITETQWAWGPNSHYPDKSDVGVSQYTKYWKKYDDECEYLKKFNIGWFLHAWYGEGTFDIVYDNGSYVIPHWRPRKC